MLLRLAVMVLTCCFVVLCLMPLCAYSAQGPVKTVAHYSVSSMGLIIGDVTTTQRTSEEDGAAKIAFETNTSV